MPLPTGLQSFNKIYPLMIKTFESFSPLDYNVSITDKVNAMIDYLNQVGALTNDTVANWNKVMNWAMNDGLDEATTQSVNTKLEAMLAAGDFDDLLQSISTLAQQQIDLINSNQVAKQSDLDTTNTQVTTNTNAIVGKRDKSVLIGTSDLESNTDAKKIQMSNLSQDVINQMTGTSPVNNANPANSSVTLPTLASDSKTFINFGMTGRIKPFIFSALGSVSKTKNSFTITGTQVGGMHGNGHLFFIAPVSFTGLLGSQVLILRGVDKDQTYDGVSNPIQTLIKVGYTEVTGDDIIIAVANGNFIWSIYDQYINETTIINYSTKFKPWIADSTVGITKTATSVTFSGNVGVMYGSNYALFNPVSLTLVLGNFIVARGIDFSKTYDGTANPKINLIQTGWQSVLATDIIVARMDGIGVWTIFDEDINKNLIPSKTDTLHLVSFGYSDLLAKSYPTLAHTMLSKLTSLNVLLLGNSIFASSGAWIHNVYDETKRFTSLLSTPSAEPLGLTNNILSRKIYDELISQALNIPLYRRFDYGKVFDYNSGSGTYGQDITPGGQSFFSETGIFNTYINSNGNKGTDAKYNSNVPMTKTDFNAQSYPHAGWYNSDAMEGFTRISSGASSSLQFTIPVGYKKVRVKLRYTTDGDILTTSLTNCSGVSTINTQYTPTGANTSTFKDIEFTITNTSQPATIVLTKSTDTSKILAYWGCYYYNEPTILVNNMSYGGTQSIKQLDLLVDNLASSPIPYDLIIWEVPLLNDYYNSGFTAPATDYTSALNAIGSYADSLSGKNVIAIIPHRGAEDDIHSLELWNKAKQILVLKNIPFVDLNSIERQLSDYFGSSSSMVNYLFADAFVHPNTNGVNLLKKPVQALLQINQFNKI